MSSVKFTFTTKWRNEAHNWTEVGKKITESDNLELIESILENTGSIIIERWIYCGSQAPERLVFDDYDDFVEYLELNAMAGDIVNVWSMHDLLNEQNMLTSGKCPDEDGYIPSEGAY